MTVNPPSINNPHVRPLPPQVRPPCEVPGCTGKAQWIVDVSDDGKDNGAVMCDEHSRKYREAVAAIAASRP